VIEVRSIASLFGRQATTEAGLSYECGSFCSNALKAAVRVCERKEVSVYLFAQPRERVKHFVLKVAPIEPAEHTMRARV
jgi:hypothetical protein